MPSITRTLAMLAGAGLAAITSAANAEIVGTQYAAAVEQIPCDINFPRGDSILCFLAEVPTYYSDVLDDGSLAEGAPTQHLHVILLENFIVHDDPNPVVFISGGPGQGASDMLGMVGNLLELRRTRGILLIDQRGTGMSEPVLNCSDVSEEELDVGRLNNPEFDPDQSAAERLRECGRSYISRGVDFSTFDTRTAALDLRAVRQGLGLEQWNLHGTSYGSRVVLDSLRVDPEGVRAAVLNSVQAITPHLTAGFLAEQAGIFKKLFANCANDDACGQAFGDLEESLATIRKHLDEEGLSIHLREPASGNLMRVEVAWADVIGSLSQHLSFSGPADHVARYIHELAQMVQGRLSLNDDEVARIFQSKLTDQNFGMAIGMHMAVRCREDIADLDRSAIRSAIAANSDVLLDSNDYSFYDACDVWGTEPLAGFSDPVTSDIPTLVLAGDIDPLTPLSYAEETVRTLQNGQLVTFQGMAHDIYNTTICGKVITANFLDAPRNAVDTSCAQLIAPQFAVNQN